jgi:hypothetical protein
VGGAIALVGVGVGTGFAVAASGNANDADNLRDRIGNGVCGETASPDDCAALKETASKRTHNENAAIAGFAVGATALVATGVYWFVTMHKGGGSKTQSTSRLRMSASASGSAGVVWLSGEF